MHAAVPLRLSLRSPLSGLPSRQSGDANNRPMAQLSYTTFDGVRHTHELKEGSTRIGRTPDNDLQIDELAVSAHHCEIRYANGVLVVKDLDSVAGTYVEGELVAEGEIRAGQVLGLGAFLVQVEETGSDPQREAPPAFAPVQLADGSYSCLRHQAKRALYECPKCFDLACGECVQFLEQGGRPPEAFCRSCGVKCQAIDWSGLSMGKKEALVSLLPGSVQKALDFWAKRRAKPEP